MEMEQILQTITIVASSGIGGIVLGVIAKIIANVIVKKASAKSSKLNEKDKDEIAKKVLDAIGDGFKVNAQSMLDEYTNKRIASVEEKTNDIVGAVNKVVDYNKAIMSAVGDFKTISPESKNAIQSLLKDEAVAVEEIALPEKPEVKVKKAELSY